MCVWSSSCTRGSAKVDAWPVLEYHGICLKETETRETVSERHDRWFVLYTVNLSTLQRTMHTAAAAAAAERTGIIRETALRGAALCWFI